jgi:hypothetical protein
MRFNLWGRGTTYSRRHPTLRWYLEYKLLECSISETGRLNDNLIRNPVVTGCRLRTSDAAWKTMDFLKPNCPFPRPGSLNVLEQNKMKSRGYTCICSPMPVYIIPEDETQTRLYVHCLREVNANFFNFFHPRVGSGVPYWYVSLNGTFY